MQIAIQARNFTLTDALRSHAERRLRFALACCNDRIHRVVMRLSDINGPRGGADKRCHLQVMLAGMADVVIEDIEAERPIAPGVPWCDKSTVSKPCSSSAVRSYRTRSRLPARLTNQTR